jgi:hypothetical protein
VICTVQDETERACLASFWKEGRSSPEARIAFYRSGGFCREHAWQLHDLVAERNAGAAIADVYGALADRDVEMLTGLGEHLRHGRRRQRPAAPTRKRPCPACEAAAESLERKASFLLTALADEQVRRRYEASDGVCYRHLCACLQLGSGDRPASLFLVDDWRRRLAETRQRLADYDRRRDHRYRNEPKGLEQSSCTDIVRLYVGEP